MVVAGALFGLDYKYFERTNKVSVIDDKTFLNHIYAFTNSIY